MPKKIAVIGLFATLSLSLPALAGTLQLNNGEERTFATLDAVRLSFVSATTAEILFSTTGEGYNNSGKQLFCSLRGNVPNDLPLLLSILQNTSPASGINCINPQGVRATDPITISVSSMAGRFAISKDLNPRN